MIDRGVFGRASYVILRSLYFVLFCFFSGFCNFDLVVLRRLFYYGSDLVLSVLFHPCGFAMVD